MRVAVLLSGRGSNLKALIDAQRAGSLPAEIVLALSDRACPGLSIATQAGIPATLIDRNAFGDRRAFETALAARLDEARPDLLVLAGFMRILSRDFVAGLRCAAVNIHPSLLPKYPGLNTHQRVLDAGDAEHGATVHYVTAELDAGPILMQCKMPVLPGDDAPSLAARLLPLEHQLLVAAVTRLAQAA
jgi:phosphoribosylglycinamide formyltransferase-1